MTEPASEDIGARIRIARELSGMSLRQIADRTKLSVRTLDALEHGRIAQLPGGIYRRAIVRSFASEIGLNPEMTLRAFLAQYPDEVPAQAGRVFLPPVLPARRRVLQTALSVLGALVPIIAGILYFTIGARGADVPRHMADVMPPRASDVWQPEIVPVGGVSETPQPSGRPVSVMITVSSGCALQVVADGREVVARRVGAGELLQAELGRDIVFLGDNAGAVHFSINGRAGRTLGEAGTPLNVRIGRDDYDSWLVQP